MRSRVIGAVSIVIGVALLLTSAVMLTVRFREKQAASVDVAAVISQIENILPERYAGIIEQRTNSDMPALEINGTDYIGFLELPGRSIKLPVGSLWGNSDFGYRPARYTGSVYDGSLIIGGRYDDGNFDFADKLNAGDEVTFTDMTGGVFRYTVEKITHADNAKTETLTETNCELLLFVKKENTFLLIQCKAA